MKLKMYFIMLTLGLFSFALQSCNNDDEDAPVSEQLEKAFTNKFGNIAHNWSTRGSNHVTSFNQDNTEKEAWFDANGLDKQVASLQTAARSTSLLMEHGNTTYLEVLTARQTLLNAQLAQTANRFSEIQSLINLYKALGGGQE